eukprot:4851944-Pyramimonas_sp.AAC.1
MNGPQHGPTCETLYVHCTYHCMGTPIRVDIGNHCEGHVTAKGLVKCSPWRSCYFHKELQILLILYVDDFKLSGPADKLAEGWKLLQEPSDNCPKGIEIDPPTGVGRYILDANIGSQLKRLRCMGNCLRYSTRLLPRFRNKPPSQTRVVRRTRG